MVYSKLKFCKDGCAGCFTKSLVCIINLFATPWCLAFHLLRIYLLPCIYFTFESCWYSFWRKTVGEHLAFEDRTFPASESSLGPVEARSRLGQVTWERLKPQEEDVESGVVALFKDGIEPSDVCQGALGNCFLLAAVACLCEFDGAIEQLFIDKQSNPRGKYRLWLYDVQATRWRRIVVDDRVPTSASTGKPLFSQPAGNEVWVLLLEKAFAKFTGSYANIEAGHTVWAFEALTGDAVVTYQLQEKNGQKWEHLSMKPKKDKTNKRAVGLYHSGRFFDKDSMFKLLCSYDRHAAVMGAGSRGTDDTLSQGRGDTSSGIVAGHAYTIKAVAEHHGVRLLQLRNPWGGWEWKGKWSDNSAEWRKKPQVAQAFGFKQEKDSCDDGLFFMEWDDFLNHFNHIDVCLRTQGMAEFNLRVHEEYGLCGPTVGCCIGASKFLCLCQGVYKMWCGRKGNDTAIEDLEAPYLSKKK